MPDPAAAPAPAAPSPAPAPSGGQGGPSINPTNFREQVAARAAAAPPTAPIPSLATATRAPEPAAPVDESALALFSQQAAAQDPANDNAQALQDEPQIDPATGQPVAAADPWDEQIHGMSARAIIEAIRSGELTDELAGVLKRRVNPNGVEMTLPVRDIEHGFMMERDYTQGKQALSQARAELEGNKNGLRNLFAGMETPEGFAGAMERMGYVSNARAMVTRNWGTPEQPNVQGMVDDMRRLGHWGTFTKAAIQYVKEAEDRLHRYGHAQDPQGALRMFEDDERREDQRWTSILEAEKARDKVMSEQAKAKRDALLQQRQEPPDPGAQQAFIKQIADARGVEFARFGIPMNAVAQATFTEKWKVHDRMIREDLRARGDKRVPSIREIAYRAAFATYQELAAAGQLGTSPAAPANGNGAPPAPAAVGGLPTRPTAAPVTTNAPRLSPGITPDQFRERRQQLRTGRG